MVIDHSPSYIICVIPCRYGFVTFETQEDAEKIIKKEVRFTVIIYLSIKV